jgi:hypothetical protein
MSALDVDALARAIHTTKGGGPFGVEGDCECRGDAEAIVAEYARLAEPRPSDGQGFELATVVIEELRDEYRRQGRPTPGLDRVLETRARLAESRRSDGLAAALRTYSLHELDGHDECDLSACQVAAVRLALPDGAYSAALGHGDIAAALAEARS